MTMELNEWEVKEKMTRKDEVIEITTIDKKNALYGCKKCGVVFMDSHKSFWHRC